MIQGQKITMGDVAFVSLDKGDQQRRSVNRSMRGQG